ncbi:uncharacterized protein K444DRAFT_546501, partial [Hyaloscypha bicolor E]
LTGRVYYDVGGSYERYFEGKSWTNNARDIYEDSRAQYAEGSWSGWPEPSLQGLLFEWFMKFQDTHDWSNVLVIGEHKQNPDEDRSAKTLVQLAGYVREVFGSQPERRFVPGFTICGSMMRLWVFDRSGPYNSEKFDIHKEPERFVTTLAQQ